MELVIGVKSLILKEKIMNKIEVNSNGVNELIKAHILSDERMKEIGFTDYAKDRWYFCRMIRFPKEKRYRNFEISFNIIIPKDGSDVIIDVLDDDFCQPYDYQAMLDKNPAFEPCLIVKEQVEKWMKYLQDNGALSGHVYGEYI